MGFQRFMTIGDQQTFFINIFYVSIMHTATNCFVIPVSYFKYTHVRLCSFLDMKKQNCRSVKRSLNLFGVFLKFLSLNRIINIKAYQISVQRLQTILFFYPPISCTLLFSVVRGYQRGCQFLSDCLTINQCRYTKNV